MHRASVVLCVIAGCVVAAVPAQAICGEPVDTKPTPETYLRLADEVESQLKEGLLPLWFPRCVDREHGGWYGTVARDGTAEPGKDKATIWKAGYHNGRALIEVSERLRRLAELGRPGQE